MSTADETRARLVGHARRLFVERGYAGTAEDEVLVAAGATRVTLHHHFTDKSHLFETVFIEITQEVVARMEAAAARTSRPAAALRAVCHAWLDACIEPEVHNVLLLDGPAALGWAEWRRIDARNRIRVMRTHVEHALREGALPRQPAGPLVLLLAGALNEGGFDIATAADRVATRRTVGRALDLMLDGLLRMARN